MTAGPFKTAPGDAAATDRHGAVPESAAIESQMADAPCVGVMMLRTGFPRIVGDVGNPATWPFPVAFEVVEPATVDRVVSAAPALDLLAPAFVAAGRRLAGRGVRVLTTSCGFLSLIQDRLAAAVPVPVATSSLMQVPWVQATLAPGRRVGVLTVDAASLTARHLAAVGADPATPIEGTEGGAELTRVIRGNLPALDPARAEADVVAAARRLTTRHPEVAAIVLECANMPPYAGAVRAATGLPVHDIVDLVTWLLGRAAR